MPVHEHPGGDPRVVWNVIRRAPLASLRRVASHQGASLVVRPRARVAPPPDDLLGVRPPLAGYPRRARGPGGR
jgi:hypothetical protein